MIQPQRDPAAYRRMKKERAAALFAQGRKEALERAEGIRRIRAARTIEHAVQVRTCYEQHLPPQIEKAREMIACASISPVSPVQISRGPSCMTALGESATRDPAKV